MTRKPWRKIGVLMGGVSSERDVSLRSGRAVADGLRQAGLPAVVEVDLTKESIDEIPSDVDAVFLALHGQFGEDGGIQALLNARRLPYTGSGAETSRVAFDKVLTKQAWGQAGLVTPAYETLSRSDERTLPFPLVVKPPREGSSIGVHRVDDESQWDSACEDALQHGDVVLVEAFIDGRELTVSIIDGVPLPIVEIEAPGKWYGYSAKYTTGASRYTVPAELTTALSEHCRSVAIDAYHVLGCRGAARIDLRLSRGDQPMLLEANTIPGFTETSLLPMAAAADGLSFSQLCDRILQSACTDGGDDVTA